MPPALHHRDFRLFWTGQMLSSMGSQFSSVAMAWQIYELTNSPLQIGLLGLARAIPQMSLMLVGGLLADALDRRRLLMGTQLAQFCVSASLVVITLLGHISPPILFAASVLLALFTAFEAPARQSFVPNLVPREDLTSAIALNSTQRSVGTIIGPSIAGMLIATLGSAWCYAVDASSWLTMLVMLLLIRTRPTERRGGVSLGALREGISFVRGQPIILSLMILDFNANFFGSPKALLPVYARDLLQVGPQGLGILYAASSVGAIVSALAISVVGQPRKAGLGVIIGIVFYALCAMGFALSTSFGLSVLLLAGMGVGDALSAVLRSTINQLVTPDDLRGRMSAVNQLFTSSGPQLGQLESGVVASWWGAETAAFTGGLATLLIATSVGCVPVLRRFRLPSAAVDPART